MNPKPHSSDSKTELITIPIKLFNGDDNSNAVIHLKRTLFSNEDEEDITIVWNDETGEETEHCYFMDLSDVQRYMVLEAIQAFDSEQVKRNL